MTIDRITGSNSVEGKDNNKIIFRYLRSREASWMTNVMVFSHPAQEEIPHFSSVEFMKMGVPVLDKKACLVFGMKLDGGKK